MQDERAVAQHMHEQEELDTPLLRRRRVAGLVRVQAAPPRSRSNGAGLWIGLIVIALVGGGVISRSVDAWRAGTPPSGFGQNGDLIAEADGIWVSVQLGNSEVDAGESLAIDTVIANQRSEPVVLAADECGAPVIARAKMAIPLSPSGTMWTGEKEAFKEFVLENAYREGAEPALEPRTVLAQPTNCQSSDFELTLDPGETISTSLAWPAVLIAGVAAQPGSIPIEIVVGHDPVGSQPSYAPDHEGPMDSWVRNFSELVVDATVDIQGLSRTTISAPQAVDALLADARFADWLVEEPATSWSLANLLLVNVGAAQGIMPEGPSWEIDLFRGPDDEREWAIGFVDPSTGDVRSLTICANPCAH